MAHYLAAMLLAFSATVGPARADQPVVRDFTTLKCLDVAAR